MNPFTNSTLKVTILILACPIILKYGFLDNMSQDLSFIFQTFINFLSNHYVKYRIWFGGSLNDGPKDVEFTDSYAKKFSKKLREAAEQAVASYGTKSKSLDNPL